MGQTWKCNGDDKRTMPRWLWEKDLSILSNEEEMAKVLLAWKKAENRKEIILPLVQNLEGAVLGADVIKRENYWTTGDYPFSRLEEIKPEQFTLMQDKRIKTIIEVTKKLKEKPLILEAEAPFSILAALIDPMKLYLAMQTEPEKLSLLYQTIKGFVRSIKEKILTINIVRISCSDSFFTFVIIIFSCKKFPYKLHSLIIVSNVFFRLVSKGKRSSDVE